MTEGSAPGHLNTKNKDLTPKRITGTSALRPDAIDKVRGEAMFVDDLAFSGMLYGRVIRSSEPHARLTGLDLAEVESSRRLVMRCCLKYRLPEPIRRAHLAVQLAVHGA